MSLVLRAGELLPISKKTNINTLIIRTMKRNRWLILMGIAALAMTSASAQNDWDFDDIYNNQKQVQEQRKAISAREKAEREKSADNAKKNGLVPIEKTLATQTTITRMNMTKMSTMTTLRIGILMPITEEGMQRTLRLVAL